MTLSIEALKPTPWLSAELSPTLKNMVPEMRAIRKVRQKVERAKAVFGIILDCPLTTASPK